MSLIQGILIFLSTAFLYLAMDFYFVSTPNPPKEKKKIGYKELSQFLEEKANKTSKENRDRIYINTILKKKQRLSYRFKRKILDVIYSEYNSISLTAYIILTAISTVIGISISRIFNNPATTIILAFMFMVIPYLLISYNNNQKKIQKDKKLQMTMGNLATAYIRSADFLEAVESSLDIIPEPLKKDFEYFVRSARYIEQNKMDAMVSLKEKINNPYFDKFINLAINADLGEKNLKYTILGIAPDYKRYIDINDDFARKVSDHNKLFLVALGCFPGTIAIIRAMSQYYYEILTNTMPGKITITAILLILAVISMLFVKINKPVKIKL